MQFQKGHTINNGREPWNKYKTKETDVRVAENGRLVGIANTGRKATEQHCKNMSISMKGKNTGPKTEKHKKALSKSCKGTHLGPFSEERKKGLRIARWGADYGILGDHGYGEDWDVQKHKALVRDNYKCTNDIVGRTRDYECNGHLDVHHIIPHRLTQDNNLNNLETLCKHCHLVKERQFRWVL